MSVEPEQRGAALENEQLGMCLILSFHGNCPWEVSFPLQALGQGYLANLSDRGLFARLAEGQHPFGAAVAPTASSSGMGGSFGVSCRAGGGGSFLYGPAAIHGTPSREEEARLNQRCLRERERGWLQPPCFLRHLPSFELIFDDPVERQGWLEPARFAALFLAPQRQLAGVWVRCVGDAHPQMPR